MSYYAIGIGGTGAKCIEALTHLAAAGMMPDGNLYTLFVDPDTSNGSLERAKVTIRNYTDCKKGLALGTGIDFLKTNILWDDSYAWSPFESQVQPTLEGFFYYNILKAEERDIFNVLYSQAERQTSLKKGFRGHPSIGAAVMASKLQLDATEPWKTLCGNMDNDIEISAVEEGNKGAKIFLFGSIFGGTGASGFPTIAQLLHQRLQTKGSDRRKIGGALILPYFSFIPDSRAQDEDEKLRARSDYFMMTSQVALKYYYHKKDIETYDAVYLLGDETPASVDFSTGAETQRNDPHYIELCAALAAIKFFKEGRSTSSNKYFVIGRESREQLNWGDLPDGNKGNIVRQKINNLVRFAFAYSNIYAPALDSIRKDGKGYRFPWHVNLIERSKDVDLQNTGTIEEELERYCRSFILWFSKVQTSAEGEQINLINYSALDSSDLSAFDSLVLPVEHRDPHALDKLFERMCSAKVSADAQANGFGKFIHALYRECCT